LGVQISNINLWKFVHKNPTLDGVHLTEKGTAELWKEIRKFVMILSNKCFPENPIQFRQNKEGEAEKQKHFKDQITMKAGFIFPKPVPATNYRHWNQSQKIKIQLFKEKTCRLSEPN
jgi:hypothetical protein